MMPLHTQTQSRARRRQLLNARTAACSTADERYVSAACVPPATAGNADAFSAADADGDREADRCGARRVRRLAFRLVLRPARLRWRTGAQQEESSIARCSLFSWGAAPRVAAEAEPSKEAVAAVHAVFVREMRALFERHRGAAGYPDLQLVVL